MPCRSKQKAALSVVMLFYGDNAEPSDQHIFYVESAFKRAETYLLGEISRCGMLYSEYKEAFRMRL